MSITCKECDLIPRCEMQGRCWQYDEPLPFSGPTPSPTPPDVLARVRALVNELRERARDHYVRSEQPDCRGVDWIAERTARQVCSEIADEMAAVLEPPKGRE